MDHYFRHNIFLQNIEEEREKFWSKYEDPNNRALIEAVRDEYYRKTRS